MQRTAYHRRQAAWCGAAIISMLCAGCATMASVPQVQTLEWDGQQIPFHRVIDPNYDSYTLQIWIAQPPIDVAKDVRKSLGLKSRSPFLSWAIFPYETIPPFTPQFQFVQGGRQFTPNQFIREEFGILQGETLATLRPGTSVVGYIILPSSWDYSQPVKVYHGVNIFDPDSSYPTELTLSADA